MTKNLLALAAIGIAMSSGAFAQSSASAHVSGTVVFPVTLTKLTDLTLPTVNRTTGSSQYMSINPQSAGAAGFQARGDEGDMIIFTVPSTVELSTTTGGNSEFNTNTHTMTLNTDTRIGIRYIEDRTTSIPYNSGEAFALSSHDYSDFGGSLALADGIGQLNIYVGGGYTVASDQQRGDYTGALTVSVNYQ